MPSQKPCPHCGGIVQDNQKNCPFCGGRIKGNAHAQKRNIVIAASLTVFLVLGSLGLCFASGLIQFGAAVPEENEQGAPFQTKEPTPAPQEAEDAQEKTDETTTPAKTEDEEADTSKEEESVGISDEEKEQAPASETNLDLADREDAYLINRYLSNFSELNSFMDGYQSKNPDLEQVFFFAYGHALLNAPRSSQEGTFWPNHASTPYYSRVPMELLSTYSQLFLKVPFTTNDIPFDLTAFEDSYVYSYLSDIKPEGIAVATELTPLGNNEYRVDFDIYGSGYDYNVTDDAYYHMSKTQLSEFFDQPYPAYQGTATIAAGYDEEEAPFKLLTYSAKAV
ncbi:MAG: zinc ribbon domain-containing protein [Adlercreutzia sp.]|nr:zinc ribbon domain-containing protein [Adlercreutzia sp.]